MKNFIYNTPTKVYFGKGQEDNIGTILKSYNAHKVLLHYGKSSVKKIGLLDKIITKLNEEAIEFYELGGVEPNPKLSLVQDLGKNHQSFFSSICKEIDASLIFKIH